MNPLWLSPEEELVQLVIRDDRNGTLGAEILRRFYVTIDYPNSQIKFRPTSKVKDSFNYNMSGLEISNPFPGVSIFTIDNVRDDSPGFHAGLLENDQIISINKKNYDDLSLNDINLLLQSKEDKKISMIVLRARRGISNQF